MLMQDKTWKLANTRRLGENLTEWKLEFGKGTKHHTAVITLELHPRSAFVSIKFAATAITYARAEAARIFAIMCDTLGDLAFGAGEPLAIEPDSLHLDLVSRCPRLTVRGPEAIILVAPAFGAAMMEAI